MNGATCCPHAETATALYRIEDELLCLDCVAERHRQLDEREANALRLLDELRVERNRLVEQVGYNGDRTSRLCNHMAAASPETDLTQADPPTDGQLRTYSMTLVDPDGFTRRLRVEAESEEEARANKAIHEYERVVEVAPV